MSQESVSEGQPGSSAPAAQVERAVANGPGSGSGVGRLPDFLVIGAAKAATSTLATLIGEHPSVFLSPIKEPEFFAVDKVYARGMPWYQELFAGATRDQLCFEASTAYTRWPQRPDAPARIAQTLPNARFIYLMRDPVDRAYSHYVHRMTKELFPNRPIHRTFEEHVALDPMCIDGSRYMAQIERYLAHFPRESFLFLFTAELHADARTTLAKVWSFLGLEAHEPARPDLKRNDTTRQRKGKIRSHTMAPLRAVPGLHKLAKALPDTWRDAAYRFVGATPYGRWMKNRHTAPPMRADTRRRLLEEFAPQDRALAEFLGRPLPWQSDRASSTARGD